MSAGERERERDQDGERGGRARTWNGRYVNIAHRRTPSELTPLIQHNIALQQQVEMLTAQNQQMMQNQLAMMPPAGVTPMQGVQAGPGYMPQMLAPPPQLFQQQHHRGGSQGSGSMSGSPGSPGHLRQRSMGHARRHSLAVSEAKKAAHERASLDLGPNSASGRSGAGSADSQAAGASGGAAGLGSTPVLEAVPQFRFPPSPPRGGSTSEHSGGSSGGGHHVRSQSTSSAQFRRQTPSPQRFQFPNDGGHRRTGSWRDDQAPQMHYHQPIHSHASSGNFSSGGGGFSGHRPRPSNASDFSPGQNAQSGRKSLFVPYLPQSAIPEMLADGLLVTGTLRVNHKNRSDAYVSTDLLDADVFIAGSKDRNRALEGDLVAVELLDVDEVWDQKREKEEKKRRRGDGTSFSSSGAGAQSGAASSRNSAPSAGAATNDGKLVETQEGTLRRRGSLRQRAPQKRNDDVEVEGQTLLLREEVGNGDVKPLYAGHVVAILERPAGQLFSGTLGLLRPSSIATRERQNNQAGNNSNGNNNSQQGGGNNNNQGHGHGRQHSTPSVEEQRPKIVWFKPTDKCVPLMAIPTEQAPVDLVENPSAYADQIFVAQIKRWPITSLHPFGMLVEKLGHFDDPEVEQTAALRDFNFGPHKFSEGAAAEAADAAEAMDQVASTLPPALGEPVLLGPDVAAAIINIEDEARIAISVLDITPFVRRNGLLDRELRHKSAGVFMRGHTSPLLPHYDTLAFAPSKASPALTVEIALESGAVRILRQAVTPKEGDVGQFRNIAALLAKRRGTSGNFDEDRLDLSAILDVVVPARAPLSQPTREEKIVNELLYAANATVASELLRSAAVGLNALLRREAEPPISRLEAFAALLRSQGVKVDTTTSETLIRSLSAALSPRQATAVKAAVAKILSRQLYAVAARTDPGQMGHYWLGFDAYTHFTNPLLRYADHVVARQVHALLGTPDVEEAGAQDLAAELSFRYDCARGVQEQSFHLELSHSLNSEYRLVSAVVVAVYESAFDVVVPELSVEKRVHGDQLPLVKAEFMPSEYCLELYWTPGVDSAQFAPENDKGMLAEQKTPSLSDEIKEKLVLRPAEHVQEIRPLAEIPILIRVAPGERVLPSIMVRAANPFA